MASFSFNPYGKCTNVSAPYPHFPSRVDGPRVVSLLNLVCSAAATVGGDLHGVLVEPAIEPA
jgi:hypothetical protein